MHRRSHGDAWAERLMALALAVALGIGLVLYYNSRRVIPTSSPWARPCRSSRESGTAFRSTPPPARLPKVFPPKLPEGDSRLWLWLGNSQLHSINQLRDNDEIAPVHASRKLGFMVFGLSLPNASVREALHRDRLALAHSHPQWILLPRGLRQDAATTTCARGSAPSSMRPAAPSFRPTLRGG